MDEARLPNQPEGIRRPKNELGGMDWEKLPDEVFTKVAALKSRIHSDPLMAEAFKVFQNCRVAENSALWAYKMLLIAEKLKAEEGREHPENQHGSRPTNAKSFAVDKINEAEAAERPLLAEREQRASKNQKFGEAYREVEESFNAIVGICIPKEEPRSPWDKPHPSDRAIFDKAVFQLLQNGSGQAYDFKG